MPAVQLLIKSTIDHSECRVCLPCSAICEAVSELVAKNHPKLTHTVRVDLHAATEDILLVGDYLRHSDDGAWVQPWATHLKRESILPVLAIATALKIAPLCRLLYVEIAAAPVDQPTLDKFFADEVDG
jgi:hypothetical protein